MAHLIKCFNVFVSSEFILYFWLKCVFSFYHVNLNKGSAVYNILCNVLRLIVCNIVFYDEFIFSYFGALCSVLFFLTIIPDSF